MSKTLTFLIIVVLLGGGLIGLFTNFNPLTTAQNFIQNPTTILPWLESALQLIKQNIFGFITGFGAMLALAARAYSSHKQKTTQTVDTLKAQSSETITQLEASKQELETKLSTQQDGFTGTVQKLSNQLADTQQDYHTAVEQLRTTTDERNMLSNQLKTTQTELEQYKKKFGTLYVK